MIASLAISLGVVGLRLVNDPEWWARLLDSARGSTVGVVARLEGDVRHKADAGMIWRDLPSAPQSVSDGDTIHTSETGLAALLLEGGVELRIQPGSLVVIRRPPGITTSQWLSQFMGRDVDRSMALSGLEVVQGSVKVTKNDTSQVFTYQGSDGKSIYATDTQSLSGNTQQREDAELRAISPLESASSRFFVDSKSGMADVKLAWKLGRPARKIRLEVEGDNQRTLDFSGSTQVALTRLPPGTYRWRAIANPDDAARRGETEWTRFVVLAVLPPVLVGPPEGMIIERAGTDPVPVTLRWKSSSASAQTEIEVISYDAGVNRRNAVSAGNSSVFFELANGTYSWRARTLEIEGRDSQWSEANQFVVRTKAPAVEIPEKAAQVAPPPIPSSKGEEGESKPIPQEVAPLPKPVVPKRKARPPVRVEPEEPVEMLPRFAEIAAIARARRTGNLPETEKADIELLPTFEIESADRLATKKDVRQLSEVQVKLRWKPLDGVNEYLVHIYKADGTTIQERRVQEPEMLLVLRSLRDIRYEYRVSADIEPGRRLSSGRVPLVVELPPPALAEPDAGKNLGAVRRVTLVWSRTSLTQEYEVEISSDQDFERIVRKGVVQGNVAAFDLPDAGRYFWRVRSQIYGRKSGWSEGRSFVAE